MTTNDSRAWWGMCAKLLELLPSAQRRNVLLEMFELTSNMAERTPLTRASAVRQAELLLGVSHTADNF
jgi:hypothetical protein